MSEVFRNLLTGIRFVRQQPGPYRAFGQYCSHILRNLAKLDEARGCFYTDEDSRKVYDWLIQYRTAKSFLRDHESCVLPNAPFSEERWKELEAIAGSMTKGFAAGDYLIDRIDTWLLGSYTMQDFCETVPDDVVLDCGVFTGNTSLYFAKRVGPAGHVHGFEASEATYRKYVKNVLHLPNVTPIHAAVHDSCGTVRFTDDSPGARVGTWGPEVPALTIDSYVAERALPRVDFIKMDIEGSEQPALNGARETIRRFKPKMALSAYHKADDLTALPALIHEICPHYRFRLGHYCRNEWETVLFCAPSQEAAQYDLHHLLESGPENFPLRPRHQPSMLSYSWHCSMCSHKCKSIPRPATRLTSR